MRPLPLIAGLGLSFLAYQAHAEDISGNYAVTGMDPSGSRYSAKAKITMTGSQTAKIAMILPQEEITGRCMVVDNTLACYADLEGGQFSMAVYQRHSAGEYKGTWVHSGLKGQGQETLTQQP